jgi:hypothetical protein
MPQSTPNRYSLHGHNVTVDYFLSDVVGQSSLTFEVDQFSGDAHKKEIHTTKTGNLGLLITFALLKPDDPDKGSPRFSFFLPKVTRQSGEPAAFETIGFKTTTARTGPVRELYTAAALKGTASFVETLAAKA